MRRHLTAETAGIALLFLTLAVLLVWQTRAVDRTNLATTNGLWKAGAVHEWETRHTGPIDSGGQLYMPLMGKLCEWSPDDWWRYGSAVPAVTFREMAGWNALFGALATAMVFGVAMRLGVGVAVSLLTALFHAGAAFVVLHTLNSEDIMPGYSMFTVAVYAYFRLATGGGLAWAAISSMAMAGATLLHWTLTPPGLAGLGLAYFVYWLGDAGVRWRACVLALVAYLATLKAWTLMLAPGAMSVWAILLPAKASGSGWVGLLPAKFGLLAVAMPNYFTGGFNIGSYESMWRNAGFLLPLLVGYAWFAVCLAGWVHLLRRGGALRLLAVLALGTFVLGQIENVYSQPQDPQMQIQPMFIGVAGFLGTLVWLRGKWPGRWPAVAAAVCLVVAVHYAYSLRAMTRGVPTDSEYVRTQESLRRQLPPEQSFLVLVGFEALVTWETALYHDGNVAPVMARSVLTATPFTWVPRANGDKVAEYMLERMEPAWKKGMKLYSNILWNESRESFQWKFETVAPREDSGRLYDRMKPLYRVVREVKTAAGDFVEVEPVKR